MYDHQSSHHGNNTCTTPVLDKGDVGLKCGSETLVDKFFPNGEGETEDEWAATLPEDLFEGDAFCQAAMARRMLNNYQDEPVLEACDSEDGKKAKLRRMFSEHVSALYACNKLETDPRTHDEHIDACVSEGMSLEARVACVTSCFTENEAAFIGY